MKAALLNAEGAKDGEERRGDETGSGVYISSGDYESVKGAGAVMHENEISRLIIGAAIEVHRELGPGLIEKVYEESLCREFHLRNIPFKRQQPVPIYYKGTRLASDLWLDLLVDDKVILENKAKEEIMAQDKTQLLTYLRLCKLQLGLIINFHSFKLIDGVVRVVNGLDQNQPHPPVSFRI